MGSEELKAPNRDPPAILPSHIVADEHGKLYYNGHLVKYAWYSAEQNKGSIVLQTNGVFVTYDTSMRLLANSEERVAVTHVSGNPTACTWPDRRFVGYVYDNKFR